MAKKLRKKDLIKIQLNDLVIDYHLQGYTAIEIAEQLSISEGEVLSYINEKVDKAVKNQIVEKKKARQVELMRIDSMMAHLSSQFELAEDIESANGSLARNAIKDTCAIVDRVAKLIELKAKLLNLYEHDNELGKENQNRLLAINYKEVSDDELKQLYADTFSQTSE